MNIADLVKWYESKYPLSISKEDAQCYLHLLHPRGIFLKTLPSNSVIVDIGAGDGSLPKLLKWPDPQRDDVRSYAYSISEGKNFGDYDGFEIGDWDKVKQPRFHRHMIRIQQHVVARIGLG